MPILKRPSGRRSSTSDIPSRETNQLVIVLAEAAVAVLERRREAEERRAAVERPDTGSVEASASAERDGLDGWS